MQSTVSAGEPRLLGHVFSVYFGLSEHLNWREEPYTVFPYCINIYEFQLTNLDF